MSRLRVWSIVLESHGHDCAAMGIQNEDNDDLDSPILDHKLNGHEITNIVKLALRLAKSENRQARRRDINAALKAFVGFNEYLKSLYARSGEQRAYKSEIRARSRP